MRFAAAVMAMMGCGHPAHDHVDAAPSDGAIDGSVDAKPDAGCARSQLYLVFDGINLVAKPANDARVDETFLVTANKTVPPFLAAALDRDTQISAVVAQLTTQLASFDVVITRTRPASGDYTMIVFGGDSSAIIGQAGYAGLAPMDCGDLNHDDIALVFDNPNATIVANTAMKDLGNALGISTTTLAGDCLSTLLSVAPCTLSAVAPVDTNLACAGAGATQDEPAQFTARLACR